MWRPFNFPILSYARPPSPVDRLSENTGEIEPEGFEKISLGKELEGETVKHLNMNTSLAGRRWPPHRASRPSPAKI